MVNLNRKTAGYYNISWDAKKDMGKGISTGMYIYTIQVGRLKT